MENLNGKIQALKFREPVTGNCCYACKAISLLVCGEDYENALLSVAKEVRRGLRINYPDRLIKFGWEITNDSIRPPRFTSAELVEFAESYYSDGAKIVDYKVVELSLHEMAWEQLLYLGINNY